MARVPHRSPGAVPRLRGGDLGLAPEEVRETREVLQRRLHREVEIGASVTAAGRWEAVKHSGLGKGWVTWVG